MRQLLSFLNVSSPDKLGCDSGVIFHRCIFDGSTDRGWNVTIASPIDIDIPEATHVPFEPGTSKYHVRYNFDWEERSRLILKADPDVIFVNQVEHVEAIRALLLSLGSSAKVITYCHYWPLSEVAQEDVSWDSSLNHHGLAEGILLRILRAQKLSDLFFVTGDYAWSLLRKGKDHYNLQSEDENVRTLPCPADNAFFPECIEDNYRSRKLLYNSRLYKQYGGDHLIDLCTQLQGSEFDIVVTDFFNGRNSTRQRLDSDVDRLRKEAEALSNVHFTTEGGCRNTYRNSIVSGSFANIAPYRLNANWSMGAVDCLAMGIPVIAPDIASFSEFVPADTLYETTSAALQILERLKNNHLFYSEVSVAGRKSAEKFHESIARDRFFAALDEIAV